MDCFSYYLRSRSLMLNPSPGYGAARKSYIPLKSSTVGVSGSSSWRAPLSFEGDSTNLLTSFPIPPKPCHELGPYPIQYNALPTPPQSHPIYIRARTCTIGRSPHSLTKRSNHKTGVDIQIQSRIRFLLGGRSIFRQVTVA